MQAGDLHAGELTISDFARSGSRSVTGAGEDRSPGSRISFGHSNVWSASIPYRGLRTVSRSRVRKVTFATATRPCRARVSTSSAYGRCPCSLAAPTEYGGVEHRVDVALVDEPQGPLPCASRGGGVRPAPHRGSRRCGRPDAPDPLWDLDVLTLTDPPVLDPGAVTRMNLMEPRAVLLGRRVSVDGQPDQAEADVAGPDRVHTDSKQPGAVGRAVGYSLPLTVNWRSRRRRSGACAGLEARRSRRRGRR